MINKGKLFKFGNNIDTDQIYPGRYLELTEHEAIAKHAMEGVDPNFVKKVNKGDIIVAGKNFGCGSSREHAVICLKNAGVSTIIAESFARIFYRNAINMGLPLIELTGAQEIFAEGEKIKVDIQTGCIEKEDGKKYKSEPLPEDILDIINAGGVIKYYLKQNEQN